MEAGLTRAPLTHIRPNRRPGGHRIGVLSTRQVPFFFGTRGSPIENEDVAHRQ